MKLSTTIALVIVTATSVPAVAAQESMGEHWQQQRLLSPTTKERLAEQKGKIVIYDGLHEIVVDQALDNQFNRIGAMMFVQIQHATPDGEIFVDDDCD